VQQYEILLSLIHVQNSIHGQVHTNQLSLLILLAMNLPLTILRLLPPLLICRRYKTSREKQASDGELET
jgi:hypothetical protein